MKNRNTLIMSGLLALTLGLGVTGTTFASQDFSKKSPSYSQKFDSQMIDVMTRVDYEGWKQLVLQKTGKVDPLITKDNFPKFAQAWTLAKEGKIKEANIIRKELGLQTAPKVKPHLKNQKKSHKNNQGQIKTTQQISGTQ